MLVAEIASSTGASRGAIYAFMSRHKIARTRRHGRREKYVDAEAYIAALREQGLHEDAARLAQFLRDRDDVHAGSDDVD
jgi:hypothetical protein